MNKSDELKSLKELGFGTLDGTDLLKFLKIERNYLIMTTGGKPVFAL